MTLTQTSFRGVDGAHHHLSGLPYGGDICPQYSVQSTELQRSEEMTVGFPASQWHFKVIHKLLVPIESQRIAMGRPLHDPLLGPVKVSPVIKVPSESFQCRYPYCIPGFGLAGWPLARSWSSTRAIVDSPRINRTA